jgi:hypothetical protein
MTARAPSSSAVHSRSAAISALSLSTTPLLGRRVRHGTPQDIEVQFARVYLVDRKCLIGHQALTVYMGKRRVFGLRSLLRNWEEAATDA